MFVRVPYLLCYDSKLRKRLYIYVHGRETNSREKCTKLTGNETLIKTNAVFHKSEKGTLATRVNFYGMLLF